MADYFQRKSNFSPLPPLLLPLVFLISGILLQPTLSISGTSWLLTFFLFAIAFGIVHILKSYSRIIGLVRTIVAGFCFMLLGATVSYFQNISNHKNWYGHMLHAEAFVLKMTADPEPKQKTILLPAEVELAALHGKWKRVKGMVKLYVFRQEDMPSFQKGQRLIIPNQLSELKNSGNPFAFDYANYASRKGFYHQIYLNAAEICIYQTAEHTNHFIHTTRAALLGCIKNNVKDSTTRSLIEATLLNERALLDDTLWQAYSITGIVHIIAISGMHVTLLFTVLLFLMYWISNKKLDWLKYFMAVPLVWFYIALTDFPPSAVRAAVTFTLLAIGIRLNRNSHPINTWAAAAFLLLCYNPYWIYDVGVQLSFLSVLSILIFYKPIRQWYSPSAKILRYLWEVIAICIAAQLLVFPLVIYYFHQFPLLSLVANIPAALYSFILMIGSLLLFLLDSLGLPCLWLGNLLTLFTHAFHSIIITLARYTPVMMQQLFIRSTDFWLMMVSITLLVLFLFQKKYYYLLWGMAATGCILLSLIHRDLEHLQQKRIVVYNTPGLSLIDLFQGKSVLSYNQEAQVVPKKTYQYYQIPARLGLGGIKKSKDHNWPNIWKIGRSKILYLDENILIDAQPSFPVQYLIVHNKCHYHPELWIRIFEPWMIILDGSIPRKKALKWKEELELAGQNVHWVGDKGAWVYPRIRSSPLK